MNHPRKLDSGTPNYTPPLGYQKIRPRNHRSPRTARGSMTTSSSIISTPARVARHTVERREAPERAAPEAPGARECKGLPMTRRARQKAAYARKVNESESKNGT